MEYTEKYEIVKKVVEDNGCKIRALAKLGCTTRHLNRLIKKYKTSGIEGFIHGNKGRTPAHALSDETKADIVDLYKNKYEEANFTHFTELLEEHDNINVSETTVRTLMNKELIASPKATREIKKKIKKALKEKKTAPGISQEEKLEIEKAIINIENAHPRRPRCVNFGEMLQMDASNHLWFGDKKTHLHASIDDSTGTVTGAYFDHQETLNGYYNVFSQTLISYGIPMMFYTDRRTVFEYKQQKSPSIEKDTFTQFGYACKQLGVEIKTTSVAQAKGRVERLFGTLQSRLPLELKLAGVTTIEQANEFLKSYLKKFNKKFALPIDDNSSVFEKQMVESEFNTILAVLAPRKVDAGHCIRFDNKYFLPVDNNNFPVYHRGSTEALVIKAFDGNLYSNICNKIYALKEVSKTMIKSETFEKYLTSEKSEKLDLPSMIASWQINNFQKHVNVQAHQKNEAVA